MIFVIQSILQYVMYARISLQGAQAWANTPDFSFSTYHNTIFHQWATQKGRSATTTWTSFGMLTLCAPIRSTTPVIRALN